MKKYFKSSKILHYVALLTTLFLILSCNSSNEKLGNYKKEELPPNFSYIILDDESYKNLEKNQLIVEISEKLSEGQIATLAEKLYNTKEEQKRFYISYKLKSVENSVAYWATSNFEPILKIEIIGSTTKQDSDMLEAAKKVNGTLLGVFDENEYTFAYYSLYKNNNKTYLKTTFKDGQSITTEIEKVNRENGWRYYDKTNEQTGEYLILNGNNLEFYNNANKMFTSADLVH